MAEELDMPFDRVRLVGPETNRTPVQFVSRQPHHLVHSRPIRAAAAEARATLSSLRPRG